LFSGDLLKKVKGLNYLGNRFRSSAILIFKEAKEHAIKSGIFSAGSKTIICAAVNAAQWRALSKLTNKADDRFRTRP